MEAAGTFGLSIPSHDEYLESVMNNFGNSEIPARREK
jgi:hypothetical protein